MEIRFNNLNRDVTSDDHSDALRARNKKEHQRQTGVQLQLQSHPGAFFFLSLSFLSLF